MLKTILRKEQRFLYINEYYVEAMMQSQVVSIHEVKIKDLFFAKIVKVMWQSNAKKSLIFFTNHLLLIIE